MADAPTNDVIDNSMTGVVFHQAKTLGASSLAGITARVATHPFDTFKTLLQSEDNRKLLASKQLAFRGLYRGLGVACLFHAPALSIYLTTYDSSKLLFGHLIGREWEETSAVFLASGFVAEVVSGVFWTPMEVVKQRMQVTALQQKSFSQTSWQLARQTIEVEGLTGLYRGYGITLCVFVPYSMIYFTTYERMKVWRKRALDLPSTKDLPFSSYLISSGLAGCAAGAATTPLDVVKTRWQLQSQENGQRHHPREGGKSRLDKNPLALARRMYREEGLAVFGKGLTARVLWIAPSLAISMSLFELFKKWIDL